MTELYIVTLAIAPGGPYAPEVTTSHFSTMTEAQSEYASIISSVGEDYVSVTLERVSSLWVT